MFCCSCCCSCGFGALVGCRSSGGDQCLLFNRYPCTSCGAVTNIAVCGLEVGFDGVGNGGTPSKDVLRKQCFLFRCQLYTSRASLLRLGSCGVFPDS